MILIIKDRFTRKVNYKELKDADFNLVEISNGTPHCKVHGAMNRLTANGIWRCMSTYKYEWGPNGFKPNKAPVKFIENNCKGGCQSEI